MSESVFFLAIDQGTSSSRAIIYDFSFNEIAKAQLEFKQYYPHKAWVEQDAEEIYLSQLTVIKEVLVAFDVYLKRKALARKEIKIYAGITNQRETIIVWDRESSKAVYPAIVWQDGRTQEFCEKFRNEDLDKLIKEKTGLLINPYFSATKLSWILDSQPELRELALKGKLAAGTVDTWLIWKLSAGEYHLTDFTNASRTLLFNINTLDWDDDLLELFKIPRNLLSTALASQADFFNFNLAGFEIELKAVAGDQSASLFGHACFEAGEAKCTFGTGAFFLMNVGNDLKSISASSYLSHSDSSLTKSLLTTIAFGLREQVFYALEGSVFIAGAGISWLKNSLNLFNSPAETEALARSVNDETMTGLYFVPAFTGLGAPFWDAKARALLTGMSLDTTKAHIVRAMLEGIAFQIKDLISEIKVGLLLNLSVDGGLAVNNYFLEFLANILNLEIIRKNDLELSAKGIVMMAAEYLDFYDSASLKEINKGQFFSVCLNDLDREKLYSGWKKAVKQARASVDD